MNETGRVRTGESRKEILSVKLNKGGLLIEQREVFDFTEGDPVIESWTRHYHREPHADLMQAFADLVVHGIEAMCLDSKKAKEFKVTGIYPQKWEDGDQRAVILAVAWKAIDGLWVHTSTPTIVIEKTAYKNGRSLAGGVEAVLSEARAYVFAGKCASPWSLFDQPTINLNSGGAGNGSGSVGAGSSNGDKAKAS